MATGMPKKNPGALDLSGEGWDGLALVYPGKRTVDEILSTPPQESYAVVSEHAPRGGGNRLYFGENLSVLASLLRDRAVAGKVRLVYIDPPYSTQTVFHSRELAHAYEDTMVGATYLEFLRERLIILRALMAEDSSIYVHLDAKMIFHAKLIMDEIFGRTNFRNCITRKKCNPKNYTRKQFGNVADYILFYTKGDDYVWNKPVEPWTKERAKEYQYVDPETKRLYMKVPVHAPGLRNGETGKPWRGVLPPPGKHWQFPPSVLDEMDKRGEIYWSPNGNPRRKVYLDESVGVGVQDIWLDFRDAHNQNVCITGYPTEKNPDLLSRIISASSNPGDLVLDCFCGSGTTLAVAESLARQWIGADNSEEALRTTIDRLENGLKPMGDFVKDRKQNDDTEPLQSLGLFGGGDATQTAATQTNAHIPIRDFDLFAEISAAKTVSAIARQYHSRRAEPLQSLQNQKPEMETTSF